MKSTIRAAIALELTNAPSVKEDVQHWFEQYTEVVPKNPRDMKRIVNAYCLHLARKFLGGIDVSADILARWTIIEQRWPELADELIAQPELIDILTIRKIELEDIEKLPENIRMLADNKAVLAVLMENRKQVLKAEHILSIAGE